MGIIRPATPGFLITLLAAVLLAIVSFSVPYFKSVFFLKASLSAEGINGSITFGTLGYCLQLPNGTTCSKPSVGYQLDINSLVGNNLPIEIPNVVVKWITYALVLHIVALILAGIAAFFGLLAHVREMSMTCFSSCISGFGASIALLAFIFDLVLFFVAKSRINSVKGGSASIGTGIWLTLAAWLCLFFAGCFFGVGRCCIRRRSGSRDPDRGNPEAGFQAEQMRLEAVKAEADRKARQMGKTEVGLPPLTHETEPLTKADTDEIYIDDGDKIVAYRATASTSPPVGAGVGAGAAAYARQGVSPPGGPRPYAGGYAQATPGTRAVDDYYNPRRQPSNGPRRQASGNTYPPQAQSQPQPRRQGSGHTQVSAYSQSSYNVPPVATMPPLPNNNLNIPASTGLYGDQYGHNQYASAATTAQNYGQHSRGPTYQSATSHNQYPSNYTQYADQPADAFNTDSYNNTGFMQPGVAAYPVPVPAPTPYARDTTTPYTTHSTSPPPHQAYDRAPERSYTLGGGGYGASTVPALQEPAAHQQDSSYYSQYPTQPHDSHLPSPYSPLPTPQPSQISPTAAAGPSAAPQRIPSPEQPMYEDSPPMYDDATAQPPGEWNTKPSRP